ncbi:MAG TPA: DUF481 domain-containing protein [Steroidobacteraceae bacterium]|nr:DUF481 domain-containing protein [Steroidobacteraceae bacterium]
MHFERSLPLAVAMLSGTLTMAARAADAPPPPEGRWYGAGQAGLVISSGNTDTTAANARLDLARTDGPWKNTVYVGGLYSKSNGILAGESIEGRYELDHKITDRFFWFGNADAMRDRFSGFNYQATLATGIGYKFIDSDATKLDGIVGVGYQRLQPQTIMKDPSGKVTERINLPSEGDAVGIAGLDFAQHLSKSTALTDKLYITTGSLNTSIANDLALTVAMSDRLAVSLGYGIRDNTKPAAGVKKLNQLTTANVVYNIK